MKIHETYLSHDSHKIALQILTTPIDELIIGSTFVHISSDLQALSLFYWVYLRLQKFPPLK